MKPKLEPPDTHYLSAAMGWIELGNPKEALLEFNHVSEKSKKHPAALEIQWLIYEKTKDWVEAEKVARELVRIDPQNATGWIHLAYSTRRVPGKGISAAWEILITALDKFPEEPVIPYNLACYAAQLARLEEAWEWLAQAMRIGVKDNIIKMALNDDDLKELWGRIRQLRLD